MRSGIAMYMQPVQDLTIETRVSRTQYQFTVEDPTRSNSAVGAEDRRQAVAQGDAAASPTSRATCRTRACRRMGQIDRDAAGRLGITPAAIDNALYNAFGQRLVSTIFTSSPTSTAWCSRSSPSSRADSARSTASTSAATGVASSVGQNTQGQAQQKALTAASPRVVDAADVEVPCHVDRDHRRATELARDQSHRPVSGRDRLVQPRAGHVARRSGEGDPPGSQTDLAVPEQIAINFQGAALAFQASLDNTLLLILAAIITMYIVLGVLYESYIHPVTILSTLPSAGVGALLALMVGGEDLGIIAIIGIILLIGIVKKNAIMMIDFALDAERNDGMSAARRDPSRGAAALPSDPDDDDGRAAERAAANARRWHRLGVATSARYLDGRRPAGVAGADIVHDAGDLSRIRSRGTAREHVARTSAR